MSISHTDGQHAPVVPLSHFRKADLILAGGKGANLGELSYAEFAVPTGFIITTTAYDVLLHDNGVQTQLHTMLASLELDDPDSLSAISQKIYYLFQEIRIPNRVKDE